MPNLAARTSGGGVRLALAIGLALFARAADAASSCALAPSIPQELRRADRVTDYQPVLRVCHRSGEPDNVAVREMNLDGASALLLADPATLATRLERTSCWTCDDTSEEALANTRMMRAVVSSAEPPGLLHRGFLQNAGLTRGGAPGTFVTGDLCPSARPLDREFLEGLAERADKPPIALSISGLWLENHFDDFRWLLQQQRDGRFAITWTNHSYHHRFRAGVPFEHNFMLTPGTDANAEIIDTEKLLIANGQVPSLFFRFPGLISSDPLMRTARDLHLISLGANAWLAKGQKPNPGSIVLIHPNGNEEVGLRMFDRDFARGAIATPLRPLEDAPR